MYIASVLVTAVYALAVCANGPHDAASAVLQSLLSVITNCQCYQRLLLHQLHYITSSSVSFSSSLSEV
jgi:hypothetical protein